MNSKNRTLLAAGLLVSSLAFAYYHDAADLLKRTTYETETSTYTRPVENEVAAEVLAEVESMPSESNNEESSSKIQLALLLDTSGSMSGLIEQAKSQIWNIVNELSGAQKDGVKPTFEISLYQYGNSGLSLRDHYVQQIFPFTDNVDEVNQALFDLRTNGGDEYCGAVIKNSLDKLDWSDNPDDLKIIYIAGNEPFTQGPIPFSNQCNTAKDRNIVINTIFCGDHQGGISTSWQLGATLTGGEYFSINHDHAVAQIASPYDEKLSQLNFQLNDCMVYHGDAGRSGYLMNTQQDSLSLLQGISSFNARNKFKNSGDYGGQWDLTTLSEEELREFIGENDLSEFSGNVKSETATATFDNIQELKEKKEEINKQINEYVRKRNEYVAEQQKVDNEDNSLGASIVRSIRSQGKQRSFEFVEE